MSDAGNDVSLRRSLMEILGLVWGWIRNKGGLDWRIGHEYDSALPLG